MLSCWIIYNGTLPGDKFLDQAELLQKAANRQGITAMIKKNYDVFIALQTVPNQLPDFVVMLDKDILLGHYLHKMNIPMFNTPDVIETCDHKGKQYIELAAAGIPMPRTIIAPKVFPSFALQDQSYYASVIAQLGLPLIIKEAYGSFGMHVYLIRTEEQFLETVEKLQGIDYLFQQYIHSSHGRDIRVNIVGDQVIAAMYRHSETDFRANITNGGTAEIITLTVAQEQLALQAAQALKADFAGVDLLFGPNEEPLVCEVNGAAHIRNILQVTGINVADAMITHILKELT